MYFQIDVFQPDVTDASQIDIAWGLIGQLKSAAIGQLNYPTLAKLSKPVLSIYHSSSGCERIFNIVNKNNTEFRSSLSTDTLNNIMTRKMIMAAIEICCFEMEYSHRWLKQCENATSDILTQAGNQ